MKNNRLGIILIISMVVFLFTGCGLYGPEETMEIDPPPATLDVQDDSNITLEVTDLNTENTVSDEEENQSDTEKQETQKTVKLTLYYFDENKDVVPLTMDILKVVEIGQQALKYMTIGGPVEKLLPEGFFPVIPEGTTFTMNIKSDQKLAIVDFSKEFLTYEAESSKIEKKMLEAITWSLTEFPTIEQVEIRVNGYKLEEMPVWNTPIVGPLSRADGINIELANNIQVGQTTFVTLFFHRTTQNNEYLVPVTRIIPKTENIAKATLEQLIIGPKSGSNLTSSILPTTKVLSVDISDQVLVADFDEEILGFNEQLSQDVIDMLVWSLTENTHLPAIQIKVKGETKLLQENVGKPILRPATINRTLF